MSNSRRGEAASLVSMVLSGLVVALVFVQLGIAHGRHLEAQETSDGILAQKDAELDRLKIALNEAQFDRDIERQKLSIILCESNARHNGVWGDGGKSYGICQFQYATFDWMRKEAGKPDLRWKRRADQLWLLDWALRHGYGKKWSCYGGAT